MEVIRNKSGKKVQTREELERYRRSQSYNEFGNGTKAGSFALSVIYFPLVLGKQIVESVLLIPWFPVLKSMENTYERNGEKFYTEGRKALHSGDYLTALEKANEALIAVPSLHAFSDIDYWRGLSYEGINRPEEARKAYEVFLSYSERNIPNYFKNKFEGDMAWEEKAEEVEQKLRRLAPGQAR